jgi:hypothetical protein
MTKVTHLMSILVVTSTMVVGSCGYALIDAPPPEYQSMEVQGYHFTGYNPLCNTNRLWSWIDAGAGASFLVAGLAMFAEEEIAAGGGLTAAAVPLFYSARSGRTKTSACRNWRDQVLRGEFIPTTGDDSAFSSFGRGLLEGPLPIRR